MHYAKIQVVRHFAWETKGCSAGIHIMRFNRAEERRLRGQPIGPEREKNILCWSAVLVVLSLTSAAFAQSTPPRPAFPALRLSRHFAGEEAINALGANLP